MPLTQIEAEAVWHVLVEYSGASLNEWAHEEFIFHQTCEDVSEFRFIGRLGFGGKFYIEPYRTIPWSVSCYPEDLTVERQLAIDTTNAALAGLYANFSSLRSALEE